MLVEIAKGFIYTKKKKQMPIFSKLTSGYKKNWCWQEKRWNENNKYLCRIFKIYMSLLKKDNLAHASFTSLSNYFK